MLELIKIIIILGFFWLLFKLLYDWIKGILFAFLENSFVKKTNEVLEKKNNMLNNTQNSLDKWKLESKNKNKKRMNELAKEKAEYDRENEDIKRVTTEEIEEAISKMYEKFDAESKKT